MVAQSGSTPQVCRLGFLFISIAVLGSISSLRDASGDQYQQGKTDPKTYVFLIHPECNFEMRDRFDYYMHLNNTGYEKFLGNYHVVCLGGIDKLGEIERHVLPALRRISPDGTFVFVYADSMKPQYGDYMANKYGSEYRYASLGYTDILQGMAFAMESPANVKHEMAHLSTCGTWHDAEGNDLERLVKHFQADKLPWCRPQPSLYDTTPWH
jgi:hypothetical protein